MKKSIFSCEKCKFFPLSFQTDSYFNNLDTFKCPVCYGLTKYDKKSSKIMQNDCDITAKPQSIIKHILNQAQEKQSQFISNHKQKHSFYHQIYVQLNLKLIQNLYLNPINPEIRNSFNIQKIQVLNLNKNLFFSVSDKILRQIIKSQNKKGSKRQNLEYGIRKITKMEYLWYSIDEYIKKTIVQVSKDQCQNVIRIKLFKYNLLTSQQICSQFSSSRQIDILIMDEIQLTSQQYLSYIRLANFNSGKNESTNFEKSNQFCNKTNNFIKNFCKLMNLVNQNSLNQKNSLNSNKEEVDQNNSVDNQRVQNENEITLNGKLKLNNLKSISIFSFQYNRRLCEDIVKTSNQNQEIHQFSLNNQSAKFEKLYFHFYFETDQNKNANANQKIIRSFQIKNNIINSSISTRTVHHSHLYIQFYKGRFNISSIFLEIINAINAKQQNGKQIKSINNFAFSNNVRKKQQLTQIKIGNLNSIRQQNDYIKDSQQKQSAQIIYIFWRYQDQKKSENKNQEDQNNFKSQINVNKIKMKTLTTLINQNIQYLKQKHNLKFDLVIKQKIRPEIIKILKNHSVIKNSPSISKDIKLDRIYCQLKEFILAYVFDFEQIFKENFQQLDCLGLSTLPQQLKAYSNTYQKIQPLKIISPFKKRSNRIFMVKEDEALFQNEINYSSQDSQRQTL